MKNKLAKNSLAAGLVTLLVTAGLSFSANAADAIVAQAESSAITATGITGIVDSGECRAESTGPATPGTGTCGVGLGVSQPAVTSFDQEASTGLNGDNGTSSARAYVAGTGIDALTTVDLSGLEGDVLGIDTATILDGVVGGLAPALAPVFEALLTPLLAQIQTAALTPVLGALQDAIPVSVNIGAVGSQCTSEAGSDPTMSSTVAGIDIVVELPGNPIVVPITLNTDPNSALVGAVAPQQIVDGLLVGIEDTLNQSLNGVLAPLAALVATVQETVVDALLDQIGPALLAPVGEALGPILDGTVNKQVTNPDGSVEVTALSLNVLGDAATLDIARSSCGPNAAVVTADDADTNADAQADADANADADAQADAVADADADANADAVADADAQADADVTQTLPDAGADRNLLPFIFLGLALVLFGGAVLVNEKRRMMAS